MTSQMNECALRGAWAAGICALLGGCATTPLPDSQSFNQPLPEQFSAQWADDDTPSIAPTDWLSSFDDPALEQIVRQALLNNNELTLAEAALAQSIAEAQIERGRRLPTVDLELTGTRQQISTFGPADLGGVRFDDFSLNAVARWEPDVWGRLRAARSAAEATVLANAYDLDGARLSLAIRVAGAWFDLIESTAQLENARQRLSFQEIQNATLTERFENGLEDGLALATIEADTATIAAEVEQRRRARQATHRRLQVAMGEFAFGSAADSPFNIPNHLPGLPPAPPPGLPSTVLERRPDLQAAQARYEASLSNVISAERARLPSFALTASGGTASQSLSNLLDSNFSVWRLAGSAIQPIFDAGRRRSEVERAVAMANSQWAQFQSTAIDAFAEVAAALDDAAFLEREFDRLNQARTQAANARDLAWERFNEGTDDLLRALDAQRTSHALEERVIALQNARLQNRLQLHLALGGDFSTAERLSTAIP